MSASTVARPEPGQRAAADRFDDLLRAEWTKFRTVRGWLIAMVIGMLLMVAFGLLGGSANIACGTPGGKTLTGKACEPPVTLGPGGEPVTDDFSVIYQPLTGNGSITARLISLTGKYPSTSQAGPNVPMTSGLQPWSKAGIIIKNGLKPGSAYAAMLATGAHGVRMQYNFTGDLAGLPGRPTAAAPRWLRLTRHGDTVTGYDSADGRHWVQVGSVVLAGLHGTVQAGMFATTPGHDVINTGFGGGSFQGGPAEATGVFDKVSLTGAGPTWSTATVANRMGGGMPTPQPTKAGGTFTVTGSGDIAPVIAGPGGGGLPSATVSTHLIGAFAALLVVVVVAAMFITTEYRRGLIRLTFAASPDRGRVLAAKAVVIAAVTFVAGLIAGTVTVIIGLRASAASGVYVFPYTWPTAVRVVAGTAALLAVGAVLALAIATMVRRSAAAIATVIVAVVLPYFLAVAILPLGAANWLLRLTPAAGFAIQQAAPQYYQVSGQYAPASGYYPLAPWAGFAVLCLYAAVACFFAVRLLRRRDA